MYVGGVVLVLVAKDIVEARAMAAAKGCYGDVVEVDTSKSSIVIFEHVEE